MKKIFSSTILFFVFSLAFPTFSFAQGMMGNNMMGENNVTTQSDDGLPAEASAQAGHTDREEAEGKEIWEKLQDEKLKCENLTDDNFGALGEYFMGQMAGEQHEAMNNMMIQMMGEKGEEEMHIAMGKRMSNCEPNAPMPQNMPALSGVEGMNNGMMPMMMNMMMGGGMMGSSNNSMPAPWRSFTGMGNFAANPTGWFGWGLGWVFMILLWGLVILAIVALIKWIMNSDKHTVKSKSALDILKERYAKGEIDKKEFEEKKKDLS